MSPSTGKREQKAKISSPNSPLSTGLTVPEPNIYESWSTFVRPRDPIHSLYGACHACGSLPRGNSTNEIAPDEHVHRLCEGFSRVASRLRTDARQLVPPAGVSRMAAAAGPAPWRGQRGSSRVVRGRPDRAPSAANSRERVRPSLPAGGAVKSASESTGASRTPPEHRGVGSNPPCSRDEES